MNRRRPLLVLFAAALFTVAGPNPVAKSDDGVISTPATGVVTPGRTGVINPRVGGVVAPGVGAYGDQVGTATGDILEARGDLAKDRGKAMLYRSLSAEKLQEAIDKRLDNRRERVETYFELRDLNDKERAEDDLFKIDSEKANRLAKQRAPDRLTEQELNRQTGEVAWVGPLAAEALAVYRRPIEEAFEKRSSPGETYGQFDFYKVRRMIGLLQEAIDSIDDELAAREKAALNRFLDRVSYEARFNQSDERIDY